MVLMAGFLLCRSKQGKNFRWNERKIVDYEWVLRCGLGITFMGHYKKFSNIEFFLLAGLGGFSYIDILQICRIVSKFHYLYTMNYRCMPMMTYEPFWRMMNERKISTYSLEVDYGFNKAFIHRWKHTKNMNPSIDYICDTFSCSVEDLVVHIRNESVDKNFCMRTGDK